ncbi:hypothetical protein DL95DRAFT_460278 [Leptodontidium sp. 2 PMI_412]|nr:hypothetical protein DL95DRAFT_460278 [Leptodontidium sp. 2 PMI_412]
MAQPNYPKPGGPASIRSLERAFEKKFTIDEKRPSPNAPKDPRNRKKRVSLNSESADLRMKAWDNLNLPQYAQDFEHVFSQISFTGFIRDLERLNDGLILPLHVVKAKWAKLMEDKFDHWDCEDIYAAEKKNRLVQALGSANEENYEAYRAGMNGVDEWNALEAERNAKNSAASRAGKSRKERKKAGRQSRKEERKMSGDVIMGNTLTRPMGVKKRAKKHRLGHEEVVKDPVASRLRSKVEAPDLPPLQGYLAAGVPEPVPDLGADVKMEL